VSWLQNQQIFICLSSLCNYTAKRCRR